LLNDPSTPTNARIELEAERDFLAPVIPFPIDGSLSETREPKPTTPDLLALCDRAKAARENGGSLSKRVPRTAKQLDHEKNRLEPLLSRGIVTDEVRSLAVESLIALSAVSPLSRKFENRPADEQAALVQFQIDSWIGKQPDEKTAAAICKIYGLTK